MSLASIADRLTRDLRDRAVVEAKLPSTTRYVNVSGARGWVYPITTSLGDEFRLFLWFDGAGYQVKVVAPVLERRFDPHACHLLPDGRVCLSDEEGRGMPTLEDAYARSVVWANGFSVFLRDAQFPF